MLDKDHHIHLIPAERVLMMSLEHSTIKKVENERYEVECYLKLSVEGFPHPLEDVIKFTFAAPKIPGQQMMNELIFVQNHIIKYIFDKGLSGELCSCAPDDPIFKGMRDHDFIRDQDTHACIKAAPGGSCALWSTPRYYCFSEVRNLHFLANESGSLKLRSTRS